MVDCSYYTTLPLKSLKMLITLYGKSMTNDEIYVIKRAIFIRKLEILGKLILFGIVASAIVLGTYYVFF